MLLRRLAAGLLAPRPAPRARLSSPVRINELWPGLKKVTLLEWQVKEGQTVSAGDVLALVDADDAVVELHSEAAGYVSGIAVQPGSEASVGQVICVLEGTSAEAAAKAKGGNEGAAPKRGLSGLAGAAQRRGMATAAAAHAADAGVGAVRLSPAASRLVREFGIEPASVRGSGKHGHVTKADVLAALRDKTFRPLAAVRAVAAAASGALAGAFPPATVGRSFLRSHEDEAPTSMRRAIAQRLARSKTTVPHAYATAECSVDAVLALRAGLKGRAQGAEGARPPSVNDFVVRAAALALRDVPEANAWWDEKAGAAVRNRAVDVSVAVALPGGLITPIVRGADGLRVEEIGEEVRRLAARAREGKLQPEEFQGGSFTISNLGMYGVSAFSAVINPPQACILAVGSGEERVVPERDPATGALRPAVRNLVSVTLSCDARAVDEEVSARWLAAFRGYLEEPLRLLR